MRDVIESLRIVDDEPTVLLQESHGVFKFRCEPWVVAIDYRIDIFLQQHFKERTRGAACARAERAGNLRRKVPQDRNNSIRIAGKRFQEMPVALGSITGKEIRPVFVYNLVHG